MELSEAHSYDKEFSWYIKPTAFRIYKRQRSHNLYTAVEHWGVNVVEIPALISWWRYEVSG